MRFMCQKKEGCRFCAECCRFREESDFNEEEELNIKKALFSRTGTLYLYPFSRYTINITPEEKERLEGEARKRDIKIRILPKKIFLVEKGIIIYDYFIDADTCPFLKESRCSIYDKRPLICRQFPKVDYDNRDFLVFEKENNIVKVNYEACLEYIKKNLGTV